MVELKEQVQQLSDQVTHARGALYQKEELNQELQQQLAIANTRSQGLQEEVRSLNEQLTEVRSSCVQSHKLTNFSRKL